MKTLEFHRNSYTVSPRGTRVYFALTYLPTPGIPDWAPTGSYQVEKLADDVWVLTRAVFIFRTDGSQAGETSGARIGNGPFRRLSHAQKAAQDDYQRLQTQV